MGSSKVVEEPDCHKSGLSKLWGEKKKRRREEQENSIELLCSKMGEEARARKE